MRAIVIGASLMLGLGLGACKERQQVSGVVDESLPSGFFLAALPAQARTVEEAKAGATSGEVKPGDTIAVRGRIGGGKKPFVEGRAVLTLVGDGLPACSDNPDDKCTTPWDYCCESKSDIAKHSMTVQVLDLAGLPMKTRVRGQGGVKELSEVVVVGTVAQVEGAIFVVNATGMFVVKP